MPTASHFWRSPATEMPGRVLQFPTVGESPVPVQPELGGALTFASPENLIVQATHILERVVRIAGSLNENQRIDVLGHLLTLESHVLEPLQQWVERHRTFLSDLSARQAKKRRRRQKRVKQDIPKIA